MNYHEINKYEPGPNLHPVIPGRVSDDLWDKSIGKLNKNPSLYGRHYSRLLVHLIDSVSRGYTSPLEAYDAMKQKYFPSILTSRRSAHENRI